MAEDFRESNPGLHALYTQWAIQHLMEIDKSIIKFSNFSNTNTHGVIQALHRERKILVKENPAYEDANNFLLTIKDDLKYAVFDVGVNYYNQFIVKEKE